MAPTQFELMIGFGGGNSQMRRALSEGWEGVPRERLPALFVSYYYYKRFKSLRPHLHFRSWSMDSGGFSAFAVGAHIDLKAYTECCKHLLATDPALVEVYALDQMADWEGTRKNTVYMWTQGVPAIPIFHYGGPWEILDWYKKEFPWRLAIGGLANVPGRKKIFQAARLIRHAWPARLHGLGITAPEALWRLPYATVDSVSWSLNPSKYGKFVSFGHYSSGIRDSTTSIRTDLEYFLKAERELRSRWASTFTALDKEIPEWPIREMP